MKQLPCCKCGKPTKADSQAKHIKCATCQEIYPDTRGTGMCECGRLRATVLFAGEKCCVLCKETDQKRAFNEKRRQAKARKEREQYAIEQRRELTLATKELQGRYLPENDFGSFELDK